MARVAVLGPKEAVLGFKRAGVDVFPVEDREAARRALSRVMTGDYAVVFVSESTYETLEVELQSERAGALPIVSVLADVSGSRGKGVSLLKRYVERAVGTELAFKGEE